MKRRPRAVITAFEGVDGWRFHAVQPGNHEILFSSEAYSSFEECDQAIARFFRYRYTRTGVRAHYGPAQVR